ncbi:MAG: sulfotransferase family protein [Candidatus Lokiarchaeota archaeon]|nr:sulfotransferase family protein [Candidatus Lokiarchaeota archaeon]
MRSNNKVVFICGAPHSGSTLLGLILGSHPETFYAGEANKSRFLNSMDPKMEDRFCKICGPECHIWGNYDNSFERDFYEQLTRLTDKEIIIDSTKKVDWLKKRSEELDEKEVKQYLIYIMRDGRAVINSRLRKYPDTAINELISNWKDHVIVTNEFFNNFKQNKIKIHYEELAISPEDVIKTLCEFLNIAYFDKMIQYYDHEQHPLGGNTGTQSLILKAQENKKTDSVIRLSLRNKDYYSEHPLGIKLDLRWKKELDPKIKQLFDQEAGSLNYEFEFNK